MEGTGEGRRLFRSLKLPYFSTMCQQFYRRLQSENQVNRYLPVDPCQI